MAIPRPVRSGSDGARALRRWTYRMLGLLAVQFVLGIWVNLFGSFPDGVASLGGTFLYQGDPDLLIHITVAAILLGGAVITLLLAASGDVPNRARPLIAVGALGVFGAAVGGYWFITSGFADDSDSFLMAVGFMISVLGYAVALPELSARAPPPTP